MAYDIAVIVSGTRTEIEALAESASVKTITEGLDTHEVVVTWSLNTLRDDPNYDTLRFLWPGAMTRLELTRQDTGAVVFNGQIHSVEASRADDTFTLTAQS